MKKIILIIGIVLITLSGYAQIENTSINGVPLQRKTFVLGTLRQGDVYFKNNPLQLQSLEEWYKEPYAPYDVIGFAHCKEDSVIIEFKNKKFGRYNSWAFKANSFDNPYYGKVTYDVYDGHYNPNMINKVTLYYDQDDFTIYLESENNIFYYYGKIF
jgi:hypothetical protein